MPDLVLLLSRILVALRWLYEDDFEGHESPSDDSS